MKEAPDTPRRTLRFVWVYVAVAVVSLAADIVSKVVVVAQMSPGDSVTVIPGTLYFLLTRNSGAAFNLADDYTPVLTCLATAVVIGLSWYAFRNLGSRPWAIGLGMIAGGAAGNLVDRLFREPGFMHGHVVDFVSVFDPYGQGFPVFNVADSSLVLGVGLVILLELTGRRIDGQRVTGGSRSDS
ncbi:signal peptidase II [Stackebrandtia albiflava]|uniref:Lipoprotein signal peptidase n=1 Tax=Stackebrandtia albiflava TaxID=406432 RepID=A0A562VBV3_9ACTN|nr:signal peptidase II [Stackebrandtia albiflava]